MAFSLPLAGRAPSVWRVCSIAPLPNVFFFAPQPDCPADRPLPAPIRAPRDRLRYYRIPQRAHRLALELLEGFADGDVDAEDGGVR